MTSRCILALTAILIATPAVADTSVEAIGKPGFKLCASGKRFNCIVDGDTLWLKGVKVRLADIDAPEKSEPKCDAEAALAERATMRLLNLINAGGWVASGTRKDLYRRRLMTFTVGSTDIGSILVSEGLARPYQGHRRPWCP